MAKPDLEVGQIITVKGKEFEVMNISVKDETAEFKNGFSYELWPREDAVDLRKRNDEAQKKAKEEADKAAEEQPNEEEK